MGYKINTNRTEQDQELIKKLLELGIEINLPKEEETETK